MIDVVLYRIDDDGLIDLNEQKFPTLHRLTRFFASDAGEIWDWAEVAGVCQCQSHRYTAEELRAIATRYEMPKFKRIADLIEVSTLICKEARRVVRQSLESRGTAKALRFEAERLRATRQRSIG